MSSAVMSSDVVNFDTLSSKHLEMIFDNTFSDMKTMLRGGACEPLYLPSQSSSEQHQLIYREDYFSSALHEIAHWCIAGQKRREKKDFGYWYLPDGRDQSQQDAFEKVEVKPQALEWMFSVACGSRFYLSADNLSGTGRLSAEFASRVQQQALAWCVAGIPNRGLRFIRALENYFHSSDTLDIRHYQQLPD